MATCEQRSVCIKPSRLRRADGNPGSGETEKIQMNIRAQFLTNAPNPACTVRLVRGNHPFSIFALCRVARYSNGQGGAYREPLWPAAFRSCRDRLAWEGG